MVKVCGNVQSSQEQSAECKRGEGSRLHSADCVRWAAGRACGEPEDLRQHGDFLLDGRTLHLRGAVRINNLLSISFAFFAFSGYLFKASDTY